MKALILAGGRGKRMGDISNDKNKCLIKIGDKPLIQYSLDCAVNAGVSEICIVVGYKAEDIINTFGNRYKGLPIKYALQVEQKGLVHAIECAQKALGKDDFMLMLGDEIMRAPRHSEMIEKYSKENLFALCGVVKVEDKELVKKTYSIIEDAGHRIFRLIEKPLNPLNNIMGTGNVIFKNEILFYIPQTPISQKRGEKELVDLIQCAIDDGKIVKSFLICNAYLNVNDPEEIERAGSFFAHL